MLNGDGALEPALARWIADHPQHPYTLAGIDALQAGIAALRAVCAAAGLDYEGDLSANYRLPTALGALVKAALVPKTFAAGDVRQPGAMLIAGPQGWRDFYPGLCAGNLARQGLEAHSVAFDLPEMRAGQFDLTPPGLARLFDRPDVRLRVAGQLKPQLGDAARVGFPAILGLERNTRRPGSIYRSAWADRFSRSLPCRRAYPVCAFITHSSGRSTRAGVQILLDMTVTRGLVDGPRASGAVVPGAARETIFRASRIVLATGGLYGGGVTTDYRGEICETVFGLPVEGPRQPGRVVQRYAAHRWGSSHPLERAYTPMPVCSRSTGGATCCWRTYTWPVAFSAATARWLRARLKASGWQQGIGRPSVTRIEMLG